MPFLKVPEKPHSIDGCFSISMKLIFFADEPVLPLGAFYTMVYVKAQDAQIGKANV